ncbi:MAG: M23 family metallopeptidase [Anaerolineae bacterium]
MRMRRVFTSFMLLLLLIGTSVMGQGDKPFILPIASPPGPGTWLFGQAYGNTLGAFLQGQNWYEAGQRLHFGLDLSMPCGTELVAIGDGTVLFVDDLGFGSGPHNLLVRHDSPQLVSLYGHLLERPALNPGDRVTKGQVVALSGDPDETCESRPHLHLELRSLDYFTTVNPLDFIDANWHALTVVGPFIYPLFQQNLDDARRWMDLYDQPNVAFGGPPLNDYAAPYPDLRDGAPPSNPPLDRDPGDPGPFTVQATGADGCCAGARWDPANPSSLLAVDGPPGQRAMQLRWESATGQWVGPAGPVPPPYTSPDGTHTVEMDGDGPARITRLSDSVTWLVDTQGAWPAISPGNEQLLWLVTPDSAGDEPPKTEIWLSALDGTNARAIAAENGTFAQWLDADRLLLGRRVDATTALGLYDTRTGEAVVLGQWDFLRGLSVGPGGHRLLFYTVWHEGNGLYSLETTAGAQAQQMPWFGGWRWRDADTVYLAPLEPGSPFTALQVANVVTGETSPLQVDRSFLIGNGDWSVSGDGQRLSVFNASEDQTWILAPAGENQP